MTDTPEIWDDVGCLRLQVECVSQRAEDVHKKLSSIHGGLSEAQLQKLKIALSRIDAQEQEQKKERYQMKACYVILGLLLSCVIALQGFMIYTESTSGLTKLTERLSDEEWKTYLDDPKTYKKVALVLAARANKDVDLAAAFREVQNKYKRNIISGQTLFAEKRHTERERAEITKHTQRHFEQAHDVKTEPNASLKAVLTKEPEAKQTPKYPLSSIDAQGDAAKEGAKDVKHTDDGARENHADGEQSKGGPGIGSERPRGEPGIGSKKRRGVPWKRMFNNVQKSRGEPEASAKEDEPESMLQLSIKTTQDEPSPPLGGVFWVCFPPRLQEKNIKKYAPIFAEVARRQKFMVYPFCYLNTKMLYKYEEHYCHEYKKTTFVLEVGRRTHAGSGNEHSSSSPATFPPQSESKLQDCLNVYHESPEWFAIESPVKFKRVFEKDRDIEVSLVEEFLSDVHAGKLQGVKPPKGDL